MARVTLKTGFVTANGREEELSEYMCDVPGCPNPATHVLGCLRELGVTAATCEGHAPVPKGSPASQQR